MEKSLQLTSKLMLHKCSKPKFFWGDRISQLPDDILVIILSFLTMKEATCTCILSHRWKNLWTFITCLDFDACKVLSEIRKRQRLDLLESLSAARFNYVSWVNKILNSHKGGTIDKFRVSFDLNYFFRFDIDKWIEFAIQKRVRWLEVDFQCVDSLICEYPFPVQLFGNPNTNFLNVLNLNYLEVTGENLEYLLSNCPCLEILRVSNSQFLFDLKVFGASLKLKYLEITHCPSFIFLEISAVNLTALTYTGPRITLRLRNVPNLAVVSFGGDYYERAIYKFSNHFTPVVSQTEILTLDLDSTLQKFFCLFETCKFPNLKQLELIMMTNDDHHMLLSCTKFLKACPVLYRFTLELKWFGPLSHKERGTKLKFIKKLKCIKKLQCLKVLELRGFHGRIADVELAMYLFENAAFLEKVTVDTRIKLDMVGSSQVYVENGYVENGETLRPKDWARQLARELCPQAELFIL